VTCDPADLSGSAPSEMLVPLWRQAVAASKADSQVRRARVLAQEDLAHQLTQAPLRLSEPGRWSGWIPPRTLPVEACTHCSDAAGGPGCLDVHRARFNDSLIRRQLVDIATKAMARESGQ
jgi:hypothetical protein